MLTQSNSTRNTDNDKERKKEKKNKEMVTRKITFQQSQEIEKERGCGLIEKIELSGIGVSGEI